MTSTEYEWDFFIAHAGPDKAIAEDLYENLKDYSRVFLDSRCLELGDDWDLKLRKAQQRSLVTVVLISANTDDAYYQREEIAAAIALARIDSGHRVVPVYLNAEAKVSDSVPYGLRLKHSVTLSDAEGLNELRQALVQLLRRVDDESAAIATKPPRSNSTSDLAVIIDVEAASTEPWQSPPTALSYKLTRSDSLLKISPSMKYLETLQSGGPIETIAYTWGPFSWDFPVLDFKVVNNGHRTVFLTDVYFDIANSCLDASPVLVIRRDSYGMNALHLAISNQGWGLVRNLRLRFHLIPKGTDASRACFDEPYPFQVVVGDFLEENNVDISASFEEAGVDLASLNSRRNVRREWNHGNVDVVFVDRENIEQRVSEKEFERLEATSLGEFQTNEAIVSGELVYDSVIPAEAIQENRVQFSAVVNIINRNRVGLPAPPSYKYATKFDVDGHDYQRRVGISHVLKPGDADRFTLKIGMDKSSLHKFTVRLLYNNGHELALPAVELLGFVPRSGAPGIAKQPSPAITGDA